MDRNDTADKTPLSSLLSANHIACQANLHSTALTNSSRQSLSAANTRYNAMIDLRLTKLGFLSGNQDVTHHCKLGSPAESISIHGPYQRGP